MAETSSLDCEVTILEEQCLAVFGRHSILAVGLTINPCTQGPTLGEAGMSACVRIPSILSNRDMEWD